MSESCHPWDCEKLTLLQVVSSIRNISEFLPYLPQLREVKEFRIMSEKIFDDRLRLGASRKDIFRHFLAPDPKTGVSFTRNELRSNAHLIVLATSDTSASTATQIFRMLAKHSTIQEKLQVEINEACARGVTLSSETTKDLPYLNAVLKEGLRLMNPLPSGAPAVTKSEGVTINNTFVPGHVGVLVPSQVLMKDHRYFPLGEQFISERWTAERPELVLEPRAYIPFGYGRHSCPGRQLAYAGIRLVIAKVIREYEVIFGDLYDEEKFLDAWEDNNAVLLGPLNLKFMPRNKMNEAAY